MNLLLLNKSFDPIAVLDDYLSLIWTDRYQQCGDFELVLPANNEIIQLVRQDFYLWNSESEHIMVIEKLLIKSDIEDGNTFTVSGRSLESILDRRIIWGLKTVSGSLQNGIKELLTENAISPSNKSRQLPNLTFKENTDSRIAELKLNAQYTGDNLYETICRVCADNGIGFKLTVNDNKELVFELYAGVNRSYRQNKVPWVVFSPRFDNLTSSNYLESKSSMKNVTLVGGEGEGSDRRYTAVGNSTGLDRRELFTDARDISSDIREDITSLFNWSEFPNQVYDNSSKGYVTNNRFNSSTADVSKYVGRMVRLSIPKYTNSAGVISNFASVFLSTNRKVISTIKVWETYGESANSGSLEDYEFMIPENAHYIYTSMFNQNAIDLDIYYGKVDDFECFLTKISNDEYVSQLRQRGKEDLAENVEAMSFEGEADTSQLYVYGRDFFNGDVVQVANEYGHETSARIVEIVMSNDENGSSIYPTFSVEPYESLPKGYLRLSYIQSTGTQYFDTGFKPNQDTRVVMDVEILGVSDPWDAIFGARKSMDVTTYPPTYCLWAFSQTSARSDYYKQNKHVTVSNLFQRLQIDKNKNVCTVGDASVENASGTFQVPCNLYLFAVNTNGTVDSNMLSSTKLYSCQIYDNDFLIRDFVPVKNDEDVVGLYDLVERKFYKNAGTGAFIVET